MQNQSTINYLKFFHGFTKFGKAVTILFILITVGTIINQPYAIDIPIHYELSDAGTIQLDNSSDNKVWIFEGEGKLRYKRGNNPQFTKLSVFNIFYSICIALASYLIYFLLEKILRSTINKKPFSQENANNMRKLGYVFIIMGILSTIYKMAGLVFLDGAFTSEVLKQNSFGTQLFKYSLELLLNKGTLLGLFSLLVAQILQYGIQLKEENALTI